MSYWRNLPRETWMERVDRRHNASEELQTIALLEVYGFYTLLLAMVDVAIFNFGDAHRIRTLWMGMVFTGCMMGLTSLFRKFVNDTPCHLTMNKALLWLVGLTLLTVHESYPRVPWDDIMNTVGAYAVTLLFGALLWYCVEQFGLAMRERNNKREAQREQVRNAMRQAKGEENAHAD